MSEDETKKMGEQKGDLWNEVESRDYAVNVMQDGSLMTTIKLKEGENLIGRMPENDIMIDDPGVSRSHARITFSGKNDTLFIEDLRSENGVFLNGEKVERAELSIGDEIGVGDHRLALQYADQFSAAPELSKQINNASAQEWRLDQTLAASPEQSKELLEKAEAEKQKIEPLKYSTVEVSHGEQQKILEKMKARKVGTEPKIKIDAKKRELSITLGLGNKKVVKNLAFDYVREVDQTKEKNLEDAIYINLKIGNYILGKKIKL